eukprot:TRINITY_DN1894_c0_g2_i2.p2 TRINITY_DN1894_c0_g2~~TRINITY_DN1894_c0_g2_i2.p2  ORF type:complete len:106 (+),score=9.51 TRINITY_DN1894_c0_g2_i2:2090-2407(+)
MAKKRKSAEPEKRRKRAKKDPNQPKRPQTAYFAFLDERRTSVRQKNPESTIKELSGILGAQWRELTEEEKAPFQRIADEDRRRYETEMTVYRASGSVKDLSLIHI